MVREVMDAGDDVRLAGSFVTRALNPAVARAGWERPAGAIDWTCRDTLGHLVNALCGYAASVATVRRRTELEPPGWRKFGAERSRPRGGDPDGGGRPRPGGLVVAATRRRLREGSSSMPTSGS